MGRAGADSLPKELRLDYSKARRNRFVGAAADSRVVVVLDRDVAEVFRTPDDVNGVLRALIAKMPQRRRTRRAVPK